MGRQIREITNLKWMYCLRGVFQFAPLMRIVTLLILRMLKIFCSGTQHVLLDPYFYSGLEK